MIKAPIVIISAAIIAYQPGAASSTTEVVIGTWKSTRCFFPFGRMTNMQFPLNESNDVGLSQAGGWKRSPDVSIRDEKDMHRENIR
jgi:hypothetical protein